MSECSGPGCKHPSHGHAISIDESATVTSTPKCACGCCHANDFGACLTFDVGGNGRCAVCDHGEKCHPGVGPYCNGPLHPVLIRNREAGIAAPLPQQPRRRKRRLVRPSNRDPRVWFGRGA